MLREQVEDLERQSAAARRELMTVQTRALALESERAEIHRAFDDLWSHITTLESERDEARRSAHAAQEANETLKEEWNLLQDRLKAFEEHRRRLRMRLGRALRRFGTSIAVLGIFLALFAAYLFVGTSLVEKAHQATLRQQFEQLVDSTRPIPKGPTPSVPISQQRPEGTGIGRLTIPRIGLKVITVEGIALADLAKGPGRYPTSALPGAPGTTAIAGHRTGWGAPFYHLDRLQRGDEIRLQTPQATYSYRVTRSFVVSPTASWVLSGDPSSRTVWKLVLTTCTPVFTARDRLVVWAELSAVSPSAR
jgi:sortase A